MSFLIDYQEWQFKSNLWRTQSRVVVLSHPPFTSLLENVAITALDIIHASRNPIQMFSLPLDRFFVIVYDSMALRLETSDWNRSIHSMSRKINRAQLLDHHPQVRSLSVVNRFSTPLIWNAISVGWEGERYELWPENPICDSDRVMRKVGKETSTSLPPNDLLGHGKKNFNTTSINWFTLLQCDRRSEWSEASANHLELIAKRKISYSIIKNRFWRIHFFSQKIFLFTLGWSWSESPTPPLEFVLEKKNPHKNRIGRRKKSAPPPNQPARGTERNVISLTNNRGAYDGALRAGAEGWAWMGEAKWNCWHLRRSMNFKTVSFFNLLLSFYDGVGGELIKKSSMVPELAEGK